MLTKPTLNPAYSKIKDVARSHNALLIEADLLDPDDSHAYVAELNEDQFIQALDHLKPKVVYVTLSLFSAEQMLYVGLKLEADEEDAELENDEASDTEGTEADTGPIPLASARHRFAETEKAKSFLSKWKKRDGQNYGLDAFFVYETVIHRLHLNEPWITPFWVEIDDLAELLREQRANERDNVRAEDRAELDTLARKLLEDPLFHAPKVTKEKRQYLAERIFPELSNFYCAKIVAHAVNMYWYEQSNTE